MNANRTLKDILLEEAEKTYTITENLFRMVANTDLSWKPATGKNWMTMGQLLMHCASYGCGKAVKGFIKGEWGMPEGTNPEVINTDLHVPPLSKLPSVENIKQGMEMLAADRNLTLHCIEDVKERSLLADRFIAPWGGPKVTLFQHLLMMIAHLAQHKGQLFYYLKLLGKNVDSSDLWGSVG